MRRGGVVGTALTEQGVGGRGVSECGLSWALVRLIGFVRAQEMGGKVKSGWGTDWLGLAPLTGALLQVLQGGNLRIARIAATASDGVGSGW